MSIRHYVLFQFEQGYFTDDLLQITNNTYSSIKAALPEILDYKIYQNCISRDTNYDVMVVIDLQTEDALQKYLQHPVHLEYVNITKDHVIKRASFDHPI